MDTPSPSPDSTGFSGFQQPNTTSSELNALTFVVTQILGRVWTSTLVQVKAVTNAGDVSPVGFVDVQPLVAQVDSIGNATPHGTIYKIPYMRLQGGANAIIIDPQVNDIGICLFASRDISSVKVNKAPSNPGSARRFSPSDGLYIGGFLGAAPTQYVQFQGTQITILSPAEVTVKAPDIKLDGNVEVTGTLHVEGAVTADSTAHIAGAITADSTIVATGNVTGAGTSLHTHTHGGVQVGGGNTAGPN